MCCLEDKKIGSPVVGKVIKLPLLGFTHVKVHEAKHARMHSGRAHPRTSPFLRNLFSVAKARTTTCIVLAGFCGGE